MAVSIEAFHPYQMRCIPDEVFDWNGQHPWLPDWGPNEGPPYWASWAMGPRELNSGQYAWITDDDSWAEIYFDNVPIDIEGKARVYQIINGVQYFLTPDEYEDGTYLRWKEDSEDELLYFVYSEGGDPVLDVPLKLMGGIHKRGSETARVGPLSRYVLGGYMLAGDYGDTQDVSFLAINAGDES